MSITTYAELQSSVIGWLKRNDLATAVPDFITLAEAKFNRELRTVDMEAEVASTAIDANGKIAIPADHVGVKMLRPDFNGARELLPKPLGWVRAQYPSADRPLYFTVERGSWLFWPTSGSVLGTYYRRIPALSNSSTTNWLLTKWPDLYLFGALEQSAPYLKADNRLPMWQAKVAQLLADINADSTASEYGGGRLVARAR